MLFSDNSDSEDIQTNHRNKRTTYLRNQNTIKTCYRYKINLLKKPDLIQVQGQLAKISKINIALQIKEELNIYYNQQNCPDVYKYLQTRVNASNRQNDIAVITLNDGYFAAYCITGKVKRSLKHIKEVISKINRYELKNPQIVLSHAYATLFRLYNIKHKLGEAHSSLEAAISCIQDQSQSCWTAYVHNKQGDLYSSLSTVRPNYKNRYKQLEENAYMKALKHGSNESDTKNNMWDIVLNMLDLVDMKLDTPWIYLFGETGSNDTGFRKLRDYRVSFDDVKDAQQLLSAAEKHSLSLSDDCKHITYSKILAAYVLLHIRTCQLELQNRKYILAKDNIDLALDCYYQHKRQFGFKIGHPPFARDIERLKYLYFNPASTNIHLGSYFDPVTIRAQCSTHRKPSTYKTLTEISRTNYEKETGEICIDKEGSDHSSGDIYSDSCESLMSEML